MLRRSLLSYHPNGGHKSMSIKGVVLGLCGVVAMLLLSCTSDMTTTSGPYEAYAHDTSRLHPEIVAVLAPWFADHPDVLDRLRVRVLTPTLARVTEALGLPAIVVLGTTWEVIPGVLDADGYVRGRVFSWTQPRGVALWAHEALHVQQFLADPLGFAFEALRGICLSILDGDLYEHEYFDYEVEAIAFERYIRARLEAR